MPLLLAVTLAAATSVQPACSWDNPGHNPYTGTAAAAIDRYTDIPEAVRSTLKRRLQEHLSDDKVSITRDNIAGKYQYDPVIRDMHFGKQSVCASVTRDKWSENRAEPAAVYCVEQHCILVPRICGNVSRINRTAAAAAATAAAPAPAGKQGRDMEGPVEFADLGLADAPQRDDPALDELKHPDRQSGNQRTLDQLAQISELMTEEELAEAADKVRVGSFGTRGLNGFGPADEELLPPQVSAVPEADTWAMLLAGLGLVGWAARRRAKAGK
ncbi:PEP-CTERM sorting domain-containing protein [Pseudoduganella sp. FT55W]|uniref:PEP-CTERM sorting domain-containing protein n=1 Tax=Duganella rivi TaxID=2666083 RepID=A0A7X4KB84_9BURK|nr:MHFG family PEP-CTERM protein [Duganella rivi]MYM66999.1 PEP-CTERM sorting domain-containing protein [Duganella rivi]